MDLRNKKMSDDEFYGIRKEILEQWPTGKEVDFDESVAYHKAMPESKSFSKKLAKAKAERRTLIQPRAGVALIDEHVKLLQYLQDKGEADLLLIPDRIVIKKLRMELKNLFVLRNLC